MPAPTTPHSTDRRKSDTAVFRAVALLCMVGIAGPLLSGVEPGPNATQILCWVVFALAAISVGVEGKNAVEAAAAIKGRK